MGIVSRFSILPTAAALMVGSLPSFANEDPGAMVFRNVCAVCHGDEGLGQPGLYPPLSGSHFLKGDPARSIRIVLHGLEGPVTVAGEVYNSAMPPNGEVLADEDIAAVLNHVRGRWGDGQGPLVTPADVAEIRAAHPDRATMWTIAELDALPARATAAMESPASSVAPTRASPVAGSRTSIPDVASPPDTAEPLPWLSLVVFSLPMAVFLLGICLLPARRR